VGLTHMKEQPEEEIQGTKKTKSGQEKQRNNEHTNRNTQRQQQNKRMYTLKGNLYLNAHEGTAGGRNTRNKEKENRGRKSKGNNEHKQTGTHEDNSTTRACTY